MKLSRYFHELRTEYEAELDDLRTDSEGKPVLDRRLADKRRAFAQLLPMLDVAPTMLVPAFHRAFGFAASPRARLAELVHGEPGEFPSWGELAGWVEVADWARPLVDQVLGQAGGEDFLATAVGLEWLATASSAAAQDDDRARGERDGDEDGDRDEDEDEALGEEFLEQQGFDRRTEQ